MSLNSSFANIPTYCQGTDLVNTVIHTPKHGRNGYTHDAEHDRWHLTTVLPPTSVFPYDIGYIPGTFSHTRQWVETLVLMDEPTFPGCFLQVRLLGTIRFGSPTDSTGMLDADYLIAAATTSHYYGSYTQLQHLDATFVDGIEQFIQTSAVLNKYRLQPIGRFGASAAKAVVFEGQLRYKKLPIRTFRRIRRRGGHGEAPQ